MTKVAQRNVSKIQFYIEKRLGQNLQKILTIFTSPYYACTSVPMRIWQLAGLDALSVKQTTIVNWMILGTYFTGDLLHKMKKAKSPLCLWCGEETIENLKHLVLHCTFYNNIRETYSPWLILQNKHISEMLDHAYMLILSILDPLSSTFPELVSRNWQSPNKLFKISRQFCSHL